ncbi:MAG: magnesium transporter CorA family protein [Thermoleophilia bacterium]
MLNVLKTKPAGLERIEDLEPGSWIALVDPTDEEILRVHEALGVPMEFLRSPLDPEEKSRIDIDENVVLVIVDMPVVVRTEEEQGYDTIPLGMVIHPDFFITIALQPNPILGEFERGTVRGFATFKKTRFLLQILKEIAGFYLRYLGRINRETDKLERELRSSMRNAELFDLLTLEKALVYFTTSLRSNDAVLTKLLRTGAIKMYEEDEELLEDVIVENRQALEMGQIYSNILSSMMDAFASVISNNLNMVMKLLTSITIILSFPTMVASFYGMNVALPLSTRPEAFWITVAIALVLSGSAAVLFWRKDFL